MRTTVNIDDDVFFAAKEIAQRDNLALGRVISDLARRSLTHFAGPALDQASTLLASYGIHPLPRRGYAVNNELVEHLRDQADV